MQLSPARAFPIANDREARLDQLAEPRRYNDQRDRAQKRQLVCLEDPARVDVEEEWDTDSRQQPTRLHEAVTKTAETGIQAHRADHRRGGRRTAPAQGAVKVPRDILLR